MISQDSFNEISNERKWSKIVLKKGLTRKMSTKAERPRRKVGMKKIDGQ